MGGGGDENGGEGVKGNEMRSGEKGRNLQGN